MLSSGSDVLWVWTAVLTVLSHIRLVNTKGQFTIPAKNNMERVIGPYQLEKDSLLACRYEDQDSNQEPTYSWEHNGVLVKGPTPNPETDLLVISTITFDVEGKYTCKVQLQRTQQSINYILKLPVLLEINKTDYQVELGGSVAVNCSQTGYLRTSWKWNDTQGNDISPIGQDNRMRTDVSAPTKLGNTEVDNHQTLFLYIDDVRMMDAGEYYCSLENKDVKVRLDVREPGYYGGNFTGVSGTVTYEMPLEFRSSNISFVDYMFTGTEQNGKLKGGLGQLVDRELGGQSLESQQDRFPWVGWLSSSDVEIIFDFRDLRDISSVTIHTLLSYSGSVEVASFRSVEVSVSKNKQQWTTFTESYFPNDTITVPTTMSAEPTQGYHVRVQLKGPVGSGVILVSEVSFDSEVVPTSGSIPPTPSITLIAGVAGGGLVIVLLLVVIVVLVAILLHQKRRKALYASVRANSYQVSATNGNGQTFQQEEVYSEPNKERTFTSSSMVKPSVVDLNKFQRMDQNPIYNHPAGNGPVGSEYAEIPREGSITSSNLPPLPPYRTGGIPPTSTLTLRKTNPAHSGFNIYASADNIFEPEDTFEDIYSEPYDLTTLNNGVIAEEEDTVISNDIDGSEMKGDNLTPYSSVYAMPAPLDRSEGPKEIESCNIQEVKPLGVGQFGEVVLAQTVGLSLKDLKLSETDNDTSVKISVAVKKLKDESQSSTREAFEKEIKFMSRLSHRNVIRLLAVCLKGTPFIVMEYMEEGDLNQFLKKRQFSSTPSDYSNTLDVRGLVDIATQIASGMEYLATMKFIHRDLATRNCLVGKNLTVKIADFGMSQNLYSAYYFRLKGRAVLPIRWMAYECFYGRFSIKSDVWAYGVTIWEVYTLGQRQPFEGWTDQEVIENAVKPSRGGESEKLEKPELCPPELYHLMTQCWCHDSAHRPNFTEICEILSTLNAP